jgi:non-haem Fe2+, alpha-ketoglutarate-dependent halogenase
MSHHLSAAQAAAYQRDGFLSPLPAFSADEAAGFLAGLEAMEAADGGKLSFASNQKPHIIHPWLAELVRRPEILDAVESVIGPDILLWGAGFFAKTPRDGKIVSWHQDSTYWGLSEPEIVTAWVAFTPSTPLSGCMRVIAGTHTVDQVAHRDTHAANNLLSRGQEIAVEVNEADAVDIELQPGQMSLHHVRLFHGSGVNEAPHRRIGFALRYIPTRIRQTAGHEDSATLVRGVDRFNNFVPEPRPARENDPDCLAFHAAMIERTTNILYKGAAQRPDIQRTTM